MTTDETEQIRVGDGVKDAWRQSFTVIAVYWHANGVILLDVQSPLHGTRRREPAWRYCTPRPGELPVQPPSGDATVGPSGRGRAACVPR